ncbi:MAG: thiamine phosphate synthase [Myxococcota bacterium]
MKRSRPGPFPSAPDEPPLLCAVLDAAAFGPDVAAHARALFVAGADWIQLRDRTTADARLLEVARGLVAARNAARAELGERGERLRIVVNRRGDVARAAGADGVHLGFDAVDVAAARRLLGATALVGRSLHDPDELLAEAEADVPADYVHLAPIWDPKSKPATRPPLGPAVLEAATAHGLPIFAQGGLAPDRVPEAVSAGACGLAVTGALARGGPPGPILSPFRARLDVRP